MVWHLTTFSDIQNHWARPFITALAQHGIITPSANSRFGPDYSITRAEFAVEIARAFPRVTKKRQYIDLVDVASNYWATDAIRVAYETGFLYSFGNYFRPDYRISRLEVLVALVTGLDIASSIKPQLVTALPQIYDDASRIPDYARINVAIATSAGIVASYPNVKLLNPSLAATRADVAIFIYQALVYLGEAQKILSKYLVEPSKFNIPTPAPFDTIKVNHQREFRGTWVACVWNEDWPSQPGLSVAKQKAELITIIERLQELNFNALIFQVRPEGDAVYSSQLEPWSAWINGTQGQSPEPFYDPLALAIAECHKRNIELHAWFNPYRAKTSVKQGQNVSPHITITHPEVVYRWGNQLWMDPGLKVVQDRVYDVIMDVVHRYDVDGIHLDDYFYPYPIDGQSFGDQKTYGTYKEAGGELSLGDWRRENVNQMVLRLFHGIKAAKPHVKFGISPFGIYRSGEPASITGLDAYNVLYADSKKWLESGWVDYITPQLYWRIEQTRQSYPVLLRWWTEANIKQRHIYVGNNIGQLDGKAWKDTEIEKQVKISRNLLTEFSLGNIFFSMDSITQNRQGIADQFKQLIYPRPALVPTMAWRNTIPPSPPTVLEVNHNRLSWKPSDEKEIRSWTLYKRIDNTWTLDLILPAATTSATVDSGTYAVCAVDRFANESLGVIVSVTA